MGDHGRAAFVELKGGDLGIVEPAATAAEAAAALLPPGLLTWISFDAQLLAAMKRRLPQHAAYLVASVDPDAADPAAACRALAERAAAAGLDGIDLAAAPAAVTPAAIAFAHALGLGARPRGRVQLHHSSTRFI